MVMTLQGLRMADRQRPSKEKRRRSSAPYSSKIIKAGALIGDTKTLLSHWNVEASVDENINRVQRDNVFGKASRSRVVDILAIFRAALKSLFRSPAQSTTSTLRKSFIAISSRKTSIWIPQEK